MLVWVSVTKRSSGLRNRMRNARAAWSRWVWTPCWTACARTHASKTWCAASASHSKVDAACATQGDPAKARVAYQDFLTLWKDADPDIPILKQAKAEYAKLH